jgi:hypothetical protein
MQPRNENLVVVDLGVLLFLLAKMLHAILHSESSKYSNCEDEHAIYNNQHLPGLFFRTKTRQTKTLLRRECDVMHDYKAFMMCSAWEGWYSGSRARHHDCASAL